MDTAFNDKLAGAAVKAYRAFSTSEETLDDETGERIPPSEINNLFFYHQQTMEGEKITELAEFSQLGYAPHRPFIAQWGKPRLYVLGRRYSRTA